MLFNQYAVKLILLTCLSLCDSRHTRDRLPESNQGTTALTADDQQEIVSTDDSNDYFYLTKTDYDTEQGGDVAGENESNNSVQTDDDPLTSETPLVEEADRLQSEDGSPCGRHKACSSAHNTEDIKVEKLKKTILQKLRMTKPPNISKADMLPLDAPAIRAMVREFRLNQSRNNEDDDKYDGEIKFQKLISTAKSPRFYKGPKSDNWFYFNFTTEERDFNVKSADLWFYVRPTNATNDHINIQLDIYRHHPTVVINKTVISEEYNLHHILRRPLNLSATINQGYWRKIPITKLVEGWLHYPQGNFGIKLYSTTVPNLIATGNENHENKGYRPFLDVELVSGHKRRSKRNVNLRNCNRNVESRCCLQDYLVNFSNIGWDWILFPVIYNAKHCDGNCTVQQSSSNRANMVGRANNIERPNTGQNCCVPKEYAPISMLYYDEKKNLIYTEMPDMEIHRCDCA